MFIGWTIEWIYKLSHTNALHLILNATVAVLYRIKLMFNNRRVLILSKSYLKQAVFLLAVKIHCSYKFIIQCSLLKWNILKVTVNGVDQTS